MLGECNRVGIPLKVGHCYIILLFPYFHVSVSATTSSIMERGEEYCGELIEKHKQCMRDMGFNI